MEGDTSEWTHTKKKNIPFTTSHPAFGEHGGIFPQLAKRGGRSVTLPRGEGTAITLHGPRQVWSTTCNRPPPPSRDKDTSSFRPGDKAAIEIKGDSRCIAEHLQQLCSRSGVSSSKGRRCCGRAKSCLVKQGSVSAQDTERGLMILRLGKVAGPHLCSADSKFSSFVPNRPAAQARSSSTGGGVSVPICLQVNQKFDGSHDKWNHNYADIN